MQQLFDEATHLIRQTLRIDYATVSELQPDRETLVGRAGAGWNADVIRRLVAKAGARSHTGYALLVDAPVIVTDFSSEQRLHSSIAERCELAQWRDGGNSRPRPALRSALRPTIGRNVRYSHDEVNFLQSIANILGLAIGQSQTEDELRASEHYFRSLIEDTSDLIVVIDLQHRYQFVSPSVERILGHNAEDFIGRSALDFCHPEEREAIDDELRRIAAEGAEERMLRSRVRHKDGSWRVLEWNARPTVDIKGAPCLVASARDVTARERMLDDLRESERRFRGIFDSSRDAIVIATPDDGRIVDVNSAFSRIYGHSREQALVKDPQELALFVNPQTIVVSSARSSSAGR